MDPKYKTIQKIFNPEISAGAESLSLSLSHTHTQTHTQTQTRTHSIITVVRRKATREL